MHMYIPRSKPAAAGPSDPDCVLWLAVSARCSQARQRSGRRETLKHCIFFAEPEALHCLQIMESLFEPGLMIKILSKVSKNLYLGSENTNVLSGTGAEDREDELTAQACTDSRRANGSGRQHKSSAETLLQTLSCAITVQSQGDRRNGASQHPPIITPLSARSSRISVPRYPDASGCCIPHIYIYIYIYIYI